MRYATLFEVEILHDYFLNHGSRVHEALDDTARRTVRRNYSVADFLEVVPARPTHRVMAGHRAVWKPTTSGFLVALRLAPATEEARPLVPPGEDFRLIFALRLKDQRFWNYTALTGWSPGFFRFANDSGNLSAGGRFLSRQVPAFDPSHRYRAGEVHAAAGQRPEDPRELFSALRETGPSNSPVEADWRRIPDDTWDSTSPYVEGSVVLATNRLYRARRGLDAGNDLADGDQWQEIGHLANQYVTAADRWALRGSCFDLDLSDADLPRATVRLVRLGRTEVAWQRTWDAEQGSLRIVRLDLTGMRSGPYRLRVTDGAGAPVPGLGFELYLDPEAVGQAWLGVIEIGLGLGDMGLLDAAGNLRSPRFTLRFLNRATRWRYIFPAEQSLGAGAEVAPEHGSDGRVLVTAAPRPLTRSGVGARLRADLPHTMDLSEEVLLPLPETQRIRYQNSQWYSEIHTFNLRI